MRLMGQIAKRTDGERRFQAELHGVQLADGEGRFAGTRQSVIARMKTRMRGR